MRQFKEVLEPDLVYHVYNRANGNEKIFLSREDYQLLLSLYSVYVLPIAETLSYCLMPNHFHVVLRINSRDELNRFFTGLDRLRKKPITEHSSIEKRLSKQFSNLFSAYTQSINHRRNRMGSLFMKNFNRIHISTNKQLVNTIQYIRNNPVQARLCKKPEDWHYSSYSKVHNNQFGIVRTKELEDLFPNDEECDKP